MRKGGVRTHIKRVSAAPRERRCGVPCTSLVAGWAIFLLLLLNSSISHRDEHDQGSRGEKPWKALFWSHTSRQISFRPEDEDRRCFIEEWEDCKDYAHVDRDISDQSICARFAALGESADDAQEVTEGRLVEIYNAVDGDSSVLDSIVQTTTEEREADLHESATPNSIFENGKDRSSSRHPGLKREGPRETIDALRYTEYGAGLFQKSGPAEESSKICVIGDPGGIHCRIVSRHGEFVGQECIHSQLAPGYQDRPCWNEFLGEEHCHDAVLYGGDVVADVDPGKSYLVCRNDSVTGGVFCELFCTSQSDCFSSGVDSKVSRYARSIKDLSRYPSQTDEQHKGNVTRPGLLDKITITTDSEAVLHLSASENDRQHLPSLTALDGSDLGDFRPSQPEGDVLDVEVEKLPVEVLLVEDETQDSQIDDTTQELTDENVDPQRTRVEDEDLSLLADVKNDEGWFERLDASLSEDHEIEEDHLAKESLESPLENEEEPGRLKRVGSVMSLDEYKRSVLEKQRQTGTQVDLSSVQTHKMRHSDESYNYAASTYGAKVLAYNKEAKGASHVLVSDKDKYLRNPCGAEDKYVVLELSEETFVDTLVVSNFEFHSSNLKDFELLGSPVYPTKDWISLGKHQAENVRHRQKFNIEDPKLVRYLMLKMLTHWGSEFFCTLSGVEVFGVDVIKNLLDDWISLEEVESSARAQVNNGHGTFPEENAQGGSGEHLDGSQEAIASLDASFLEPLFSQQITEVSTSDQGGLGVRDGKAKAADGTRRDEESKSSTAVDSAQEVVHVLGGKTPGDSVLKILMQRVKALELNQTLFDSYLGDMNHKYKAMLSELDKDLALVTERLRNETALTSSLAMRLAHRELQRKEEKQYMEHQFALITSNFTDNLDFMRWQIQSMERRETTAIILVLVCMILSALLHLLAHCIPRRPSTKNFSVQFVNDVKDCKLDSLSLSSVCYGSSTLVLYLASGLVVLVLSV